MNSGDSGKNFKMKNLNKELEQLDIDDRIQQAVERALARAAKQESVRSKLPSKLSGISKLTPKKKGINPFTGFPLKNQSPVNKGGSRRRRTTHKKRKSHRKSKRVHHTRRKHTRRHRRHSRHHRR